VSEGVAAMPGPVFRLPVAQLAAKKVAANDEKPIVKSATAGEEKPVAKFKWVRSGVMWVKAPLDANQHGPDQRQPTQEAGRQATEAGSSPEETPTPPVDAQRGRLLAAAGEGDELSTGRGEGLGVQESGAGDAVGSATEEKAPAEVAAEEKAAAETAAEEKAAAETVAEEKAAAETAAEEKAAAETAAQAAQAQSAEQLSRRAALLPQVDPKTPARDQPPAPEKPAAVATKATLTKKHTQSAPSLPGRPPARPPRGPVAPDRPPPDPAHREPAPVPAVPQTPKKTAAPAAPAAVQTPKRASPCSAISTTPGSAATRVAPLRPLATCAPHTPKTVDSGRQGRPATQRSQRQSVTALVGPGLAAQVLTVPEHFTKVKGVALEGVRVDLSTLHIPSEPVVDLTAIILPKTPAYGAPWPSVPIDTFSWPEIADHLPTTPNTGKMMPMMCGDGLTPAPPTLLPPPVFNFGLDLGTDFVMGNPGVMMPPVWECPAVPMLAALLDPVVLADELRGRAVVLGPVGVAGIVAQAPDQVVALLSSISPVSYAE